jgi:hypothetical protein
MQMYAPCSAQGATLFFKSQKQNNKMEVEVKVVNAFSVNNEGGNPAGVVLGADVLSTKEKQSIAYKVGVPEPHLFPHPM